MSSSCSVDWNAVPLGEQGISWLAVRPLEDVRIVAVEQYGAGPWGSVHLADLGAEVIKIEDPRTAGDVGRTVPPYRDGDHSLFFETFNRNKRSLALDISTPGGREVFEDLVRVSDAVWSNLRGDVPASASPTTTWPPSTPGSCAARSPASA
jgi:crotonobetainyl-CoA:carnitine CoA-transferase CaiB-like acyl-CoA transferase